MGSEHGDMLALLVLFKVIAIITLTRIFVLILKL